MRRSTLMKVAAGAAVIALMAPSRSAAQQAAETGPRVGDMAPDFTLGGATRFGLLRNQVNLAGYRGNTVVLAFFVRARTRG